VSDKLAEILAKMQAAQNKTLIRQQQVNEAVNDSLAGGLGGLAGVADALDQLRQKPDAYPQVPNEGARQQALAALARAQLDASNRNANVAMAVNAGVNAGLQGIADVAAGMRQMAQAPADTPDALPREQLEAQQRAERLMAALKAARGTSDGDELLPALGDDPPVMAPMPVPAAPPAPVVAVCPTCQGSGRVVYH
jgi:hypothetical protein